MLLDTSSVSSYYQYLHSLKLVRNLQMMQTRKFKLARVKVPLASQYKAASAQLQGSWLFPWYFSRHRLLEEFISKSSDQFC